MVSLLPKRSRYGSDFDGLCKDIGELSAAKIVNAYTIHRAVASLQNLNLGTMAAQQPPSPHCLPQLHARGVSVAQQLVQPPQLRSPSQHPLSASRPPPHMPNDAPVPQPPPQTPSQRRLCDAVPGLVAENTPEERARRSGLVAEYNAKYGEDTTPNLSRSFPCCQELCNRLGIVWLKEPKRSMRAAILHALNKPHSLQAGTVPGTPTPGPRFARDTAQLEEEDEGDQTDYVVSENEEGQ
ncbi:hypothetical protein RhiJN_27048 [Ceratobasidium sp. AG-Ba]|nr:hypothetical protein RhiJN_27048 [Ceratobasidium sp. AG-Ba]